MAGLSVSKLHEGIVFADLREKLNQKQETFRVIVTRVGNNETRVVEMLLSESTNTGDFFNNDLDPVSPDPFSPVSPSPDEHSHSNQDSASHDEQSHSQPSAQEQDINTIALLLKSALHVDLQLFHDELHMETDANDLRATMDNLNGYGTYEHIFQIQVEENEFAE